MNFWAKLGSVSLFGFVLGVGAGDYIEHGTDRVSAGIELFESVCVPAAKHVDMTAELDLNGLVPIGLPHSWADPQGLFLLELNANQCSVSDVLLQLDAEERIQFNAKAAALVATEFPLLSSNENHGLEFWDTFQLWSQTEQFDGRSWSVSLSRYSDIQGDLYDLLAVSHTTLLVNFSPN